MSALPFHLLGFGVRPDEDFGTVRDLAIRILELNDAGGGWAEEIWLGQCEMVRGALGAHDETVRGAVFVRRADGAGGAGDFLGIATLPLDPREGSFGARASLATALRRARPSMARAA